MDGVDAKRNRDFGGVEEEQIRCRGEQVPLSVVKMLLDLLDVAGEDSQRPVVVLQFHNGAVVPPDRLRPPVSGELARRIQQAPQHHPEDHRGGIVGRRFLLWGAFDRFRQAEFLPQGSKDRNGAEGQCRGRHQFLGLAPQLLLLHVPGKGIGKFFEGAAGDQFVEAPEVGDDLLAEAAAFPVCLDIRRYFRCDPSFREKARHRRNTTTQYQRLFTVTVTLYFGFFGITR